MRNLSALSIDNFCLTVNGSSSIACKVSSSAYGSLRDAVMAAVNWIEHKPVNADLDIFRSP